MALTKCNECGKDVSDKALVCPHCGNPISTDLFSTEEAPPTPLVLESLKENKEKGSFKKTIRPIIIIVCLLGLLTILFFYYIEIIGKYVYPLINKGANGNQLTISLKQSTPTPTDSSTVQINADGKKTYPVQYNNLWGHEFYTSKIDQTGNIDIGSAPKQTIAKLLNSLGYPQRLTKNLVFVNADPTIIKPGDQLEIPWAVGSSARLDLKPQVGTYQDVYGGAVIALNNLSGYNQATLTHELGHIIGAQLTDEEWQQYYKLRNIPSATPRRNTSDWNLSPFEDFAEVYKATYKTSIIGSSEYSMENNNWAIRTKYGFFVSSYESANLFSSCYSIEQGILDDLIKAWWENTSSNSQIGYMMPTDVMNKLQDQASADPKVQSCRKNNTEQSLLGGPMFVSQAGPATQQFIKNVVARLNSSM